VVEIIKHINVNYINVNGRNIKVGKVKQKRLRNVNCIIVNKQELKKIMEKKCKITLEMRNREQKS